MSKTYDRHVHTHVVVDTRHFAEPAIAAREGWGGTFPIVLHTGGRVWIGGSYSHALTDEIARVGDGYGNGYDEDGNCLLSIPADWCSFYDEDEAEGIERCLDADARLLSYAR